MKKYLLAACIAALFIAPAVAADFPVKAAAPLPVSPIYNWSGFYLGLNVGGAWNDTRDDVSPTGCFLTSVTCGGGTASNALRSDSVNLGGSGFTGGGQAGYNWQIGKFVGGFEGDINFVGINDGNSVNRQLAAPLSGNFIHSETDKLQWFGTVRGRAGVTVTPSVLLYATGGLAFGQVKSVSSVSFTFTKDTYAGALDDTRVGWTVGGGGEWMIAPQWSIKAEYLFVDLGKASYTQACTNLVCGSPPQVSPGASYQTDLRVRENIGRVGVNYSFGAH